MPTLLAHLQPEDSRLSTANIPAKFNFATSCSTLHTCNLTRLGAPWLLRVTQTLDENSANMIALLRQVCGEVIVGHMTCDVWHTKETYKPRSLTRLEIWLNNTLDLVPTFTKPCAHNPYFLHRKSLISNPYIFDGEILTS